jgi:peptide/nickel transport system substrate-binding protein
MRKITLVVLSLLLLVAMGWADSSFSHQLSARLAPQQNNIIIGANQEPDQLNPWEGAADTKENMLALFNIGLTYFDNQSNLQPGLATEVPSQANGRVRISGSVEAGNFRQEVDWTIRSDATWSDGRAITTDDVLFTLEVQQHPLIPVTFRTFSNTIEEVRVSDSKNFTIVYNAPNLFFASPTGRVGLARFYDIAPKHVWEPIFRAAVAAASAPGADAVSIIQAQFLGAAPASGIDPNAVVGSGPFKLAEWQRGQFIRGTRRADFFLSPPGPAQNYVQEVIVRFFVATETLQAAILSGELDASDDIGLAGVNPNVLRDRLGNAANVEVSPSGFIEQLNFNNFVRGRTYGGAAVNLPVCQTAEDLLLGDPRTRRAIIQAINRETLAPTVFPGGIVSNSFVVRGDIGFNEALNTYPFNPDAAKALLAELGWTPGPAGVLQRRTEDGRIVFFRLPHVTTPAGFRVRTQEVLQQDLAAVGIAFDANNQPASVLFSTEFVNGSNCNWQGIIEFASAGGIGEVPADELSGELWGDDPRTPEAFDNIARPENGFAGSNVTGWVNAEYDRLHFQALSEFDLDKRAALIRQMQEIFNRELPFIPLYERAEILTAKAGLVNYTKGTPLTRTPFWNAWEWGWTQNGAVQVR